MGSGNAMQWNGCRPENDNRRVAEHEVRHTWPYNSDKIIICILGTRISQRIVYEDYPKR